MFRTLLIAFTAAFFTAPAARAAIVEQFKVADWDAAAFTSDDTGQFSHCSVYAEYQNGSTLYISAETSGAWYLSVSNPNWQLPAGGQFAIVFKIDRRESVEGTTTALGTDQVGLPIEANHPFIRQLRRGNRLVMSFQNQDYAFELSNSNKAMDTAQECVRRHLALGTRTPVMSQQGTPPPDQQQGSANQQSAAADGQPTPPPEMGGENLPAQPGPPPQDQPQAETQADSDRASAQASGAQQNFGQWVVTVATDETGAFANCTAYNVQGDDQLILSLLPDNTWEFGVYRGSWKLDTNATYYLWYNVDAPADGTGVVKRPVEAPEVTRVWFAVSENEDVIDRIEKGSTLNLQLRSLTGAPDNLSFALAQAPEAFAATRKCVTDQQVAGAPSKEGSGVKEPTESAAEAPSGNDQTATSDPAAPVQHDELPALGDTKIEDLTVPGWTAAAFSDAAGTFTHCGIKADYQNGATFGVARAAGGELIMAVQHGDWSMTPGTWVPFSYILTGGSEVATAGQAIAPNVIMANVGSDEALTQQIHDAKDLNITAEGKSLAFDISDIGPGIEAIDACVEKHTAAASEPAPAPSPPPASKKSEATPSPAPTEPETDVASADSAGADTAASSPTPAPDATEPEQQSSATSGDDAVDMQSLEESFLTMGVLMQAGYLGYEELPDDATIPAELPEGKTAWKLNGVTGVTVVVSTGTPEDVKSALSGAELETCGGMLKTSIVASDNKTHMHFSLRCNSGGTVKIVHYVVMPRDGGGSYAIAMLGGDDGSEAEAIAKKLYELSLKTDPPA